MSWQVRHEGSPRAVEVATAQEVVEGLQEGQWEPTDEVSGPHDARWVAIEEHPQFADVVLDLEAPARRHEEEEMRIDMTPLIDVTQVLLIFFILTTSYAALQKVLDMAGTSSQDISKEPVRITPQQVEQSLIFVRVNREHGKTVVRLENQPVDLPELTAQLRTFVKGSKKTEMLVDADDDVEWGTIIAIQDAAKGAGVQRVLQKAKSEDLKK
jgi:biopolymer transport protein ExbD